jgi:hypothetical protein
MYTKFTFSLLFLLTAFLATPVAFAAVLSLENNTDIIQVGDVLSVQIVLDTEGVQVNAVEAQVNYSKEELEFLNVLDGDSAINFWIQKPELKSEGAVSFSGITPGGVNGHDITVLTLRFEAKKEGVGRMALENAQVFLHDGLGTKAEVKTVLFERNIQGQSIASPIVTQYIDIEAPEIFSPTITTDPDIFDGKKFLVFSTQDKGSGIDFYEVKEGEFGSYEQAISPYEIKDQSLSKKISVKAVDREQNEYVAVIYPQNAQPWYQTLHTKTAILVACLVLLLLISRRLFFKSAA